MFRFILFALAFDMAISVASAQSAPTASPIVVPQQEIWFSPRQHWRADMGVTDWDDMFKSDAGWPKAAGAVNVFVITEGVILHQTDDELKTMAKFFADHHMKIALETSIISRPPGYPKPGGEGYASPQELRATAGRLQKLGITLDYLRMDEALWFGHYDKNDSYTDQFPVPELVQHVVEDAKEIIVPFPNVQLVDIATVPPETMQPDFTSAYRDYKTRLEAALGRPIISVQVDVQWSNPSWKKDVKFLHDFAQGLGMKFGIIYNSDSPADTDRDFISGAEDSFTVCESELGFIPDQPVFQSWEPHVPSHALPETDDTAHTHLIARYLLPRTQIVAQRANGAVQGQLADEKGQPIAGATVDLHVPSFDPSKPLGMQKVTGTVPAKAKTALIGIRVNRECLCDGDNDFLVGPFSYQESGTGTVTQTIDYPTEVEKRPPQGAKVEIETLAGQKIAHFIVPQGQNFGFNGPQFPVTPGAPFTLQAPADMVSGEGLNGRIMVIWFDDQNHGFHADPLVIQRQYAHIGSAVTGSDGRFSIALPVGAAPAGPLRLDYAGSASLRRTIGLIP